MPRCSNCHTENAPQNRFCFSCGTAIDPLKTPAEGVESFPAPELDEAKYRRRKPGEPEQKPKRPLSRQLSTVLSILLVASLVVAGYYGYQTFMMLPGVSAPPGGTNNAPTPTPAYSQPLEQASIESVTLPDGGNAHKLTFFGNPGDIIRLDQLNMTLTVGESGQISETIPDSQWLPAFPQEEQESLEVAIRATKQSGQENSEVALPVLNVQVPQAPFTWITPAGGSIDTTSRDNVQLEFKVLPSSQVTVNGQNMSSRTDSAGVVRTSVPLPEIGKNDIAITVEVTRHRKFQTNLSVERVAQTLTLALDKNTPQITHEQKVLITGTTVPGAQVTTNVKTEAAPVCDIITGAFSFTAVLEQYGPYQIEITAKSGDRSETISHSLQRQPEIETYTRSAWAMDYQALSNRADKLKGRIFLCEGVIVEKSETDSGTVFYVMDVSQTDSPQLLALTYEGSLQIETGKKYRMFADVLGYERELPLLAARYAYTAQ